MFQLFVSNFGFNVQDEDLYEFFSPYGEVISAEVSTDKFTRKSKGCGYVIMKDEAAARRAIAGLNGYEIDRNIISVREAETHPVSLRGTGRQRLRASA